MVEAESCTPDEKHIALDRAIQSRTFARSEQLRSFLRYVCEAEFHGASARLNEYVIGVEVLHRGPGYSPAEDSSVRTRAYELRQKLERLYATELQDEPVQIVIPKGAYSAQFKRTFPRTDRVAPELQVEKAVGLSLAASARTAWRPASITIAIALLAGMLGAALTLAIRAPKGPNVDSIIAEAWAPFAKPNDTVLLMAATPLFLVLGPETHRNFDTPTYPAPPEAYPLFRQYRPLPPGSRLGMIFTHDALGVGNMNAVLAASSVIKSLGATAQVLPERPAMMSVIHGRDAILFGAPVDSQAISEVLEKTPLSVVYDETVKEFVIKDRVARQMIVPEKKQNGDFATVYGLITVLDTRESDHGRLGMLVFSGITSVGTQGAAEYFTSPQSLKALKGIFAHEGMHSFPAAYQVVVKCGFENMLLVTTEYQAHRIIKRD